MRHYFLSLLDHQQPTTVYWLMGRGGGGLYSLGRCDLLLTSFYFLVLEEENHLLEALLEILRYYDSQYFEDN